MLFRSRETELRCCWTLTAVPVVDVDVGTTLTPVACWTRVQLLLRLLVIPLHLLLAVGILEKSTLLLLLEFCLHETARTDVDPDSRDDDDVLWLLPADPCDFSDENDDDDDGDVLLLLLFPSLEPFTVICCTFWLLFSLQRFDPWIHRSKGRERKWEDWVIVSTISEDVFDRINRVSISVMCECEWVKSEADIHHHHQWRWSVIVRLFLSHEAERMGAGESPSSWS